MMKQDSDFKFDDETIQRLFGFEDAESEPINRLKEYYFKNETYLRVLSNLPVRILVGHKGTGKSALFKVAISENRERGNLPILIKPDDIAELGKSDDNFLLRIRQWKYGLNKIIGEKVLDEFEISEDEHRNKLGQFGIKIVSYLHETVRKVKSNINLEATKKSLVYNFLETKQIIIYIDDLDRGWSGSKDDIIRISALLNAIRDLSNDNEGLNFRISLRSDVYYLVRTSDESTDKIESSVIWNQWSNHEILVMLIKRIETFHGRTVDESELLNTPQKHLAFYLDSVFESKFTGLGKWENVPTHRVLMSLIRKRPRDLVKLCSHAAQNACQEGGKLIRTKNLQAIFEEYSQGRIQDTVNEYRSELPIIEKLLFGMKPTQKEFRSGGGYVYSTIELKKKLSNIMEQNNFLFPNGRRYTPAELAQFLYKINFLTARKITEDGLIKRRYFEESRYLSATFVDFGFDWEVHPAFRWALQPDNIENIFINLTLSSDGH
jgi:hypothetical protein